jgi:hypothetical protein
MRMKRTKINRLFFMMLDVWTWPSIMNLIQFYSIMHQFISFQDTFENFPFLATQVKLRVAKWRHEN